MAGHKIERLENDILRELPNIFRNLKDPRVKGTILSVTHLDLASDLSYLTIYVSSLDGIERSKEAVEGLKSAAGFVRKGIADAVAMRKSPELRFVADDSIEEGARLSERLMGLDKKEETKEDED